MLDWKALSPQRPLDEGDPRYVDRPDGGGERLAQLVTADGRPVVVTGPVGCGKSTEMARAAKLLSASIETHLIHLDRDLDMHQARGHTVLARLCRELGVSSGRDVFRDALRRRGRPVALLIDGLEKSPAYLAPELARMILDFAEEATLVMVVSPALVIGPAAYDIVSSARVFAIRALVYAAPFRDAEVRALLDAIRQAKPLDRDSISNALRQFFGDIIVCRTGLRGTLPDELLQMLLRATVASGGVPRVFLQLLQDASTYATLARQASPGLQQLLDAMNDQADNLALLLQEGDAEALAKAFGTDGLEVPLERKLRFFAHGLLLEYDLGDGKVVYPAPLLFPLLTKFWKAS